MVTKFSQKATGDFQAFSNKLHIKIQIQWAHFAQIQIKTKIVRTEFLGAQKAIHKAVILDIVDDE